MKAREFLYINYSLLTIRYNFNHYILKFLFGLYNTICIFILSISVLGKLMGGMSVVEKPKTKVSKANMLLPEKHRLVAGIFASKEAADAAMKKIKDLRPRLHKVNASNILVLAKDNKGKVEINIIDIGSTSGTNSISLVERVAADVNIISGKLVVIPTESNVQVTHLGYALNPGTVAIGLFVDLQYAGKIEDSIREIGAQVLTSDDLKRIGAGLGAAEGTNDLAVKAAAVPQSALQAASSVFDWQAEYAYSLGLQAFIYGFPYIYNALTRYKWTNSPQDPKRIPYAPS